MKRSTTPIHNIRISVIRERMKQDGAFDGRFVSRAQESKKVYSRKNKHKNRDERKG